MSLKRQFEEIFEKLGKPGTTGGPIIGRYSSYRRIGDHNRFFLVYDDSQEELPALELAYSPGGRPENAKKFVWFQVASSPRNDTSGWKIQVTRAIEFWAWPDLFTPTDAESLEAARLFHAVYGEILALAEVEARNLNRTTVG